ncbi:hypothetical protein L7F22_024760 [Adiantum nelumboides]|nr:hypothetical protein [Adiantum nelumboides]
MLLHCSILDSSSFNDTTPSLSILNSATNFFHSNAINSHKPAAPSVNSIRVHSLRALYAQSSSPSGPDKDVQGAASPPVKLLGFKAALQGLGTPFVRGTIAVSELVVAHVEEGKSARELQLFCRTFHGSGMLARSDMDFIFPSMAYWHI